MEGQTDRKRTVSWSDPMIGAKMAQKMSGMDFLQAIAAGEIPPPPIARLMDLKLDEVSEGRAVFSLEPSEIHYNPIGSVHGGVLATACDSAASCALQSLLSAGKAYTTLEMKVNYIRPVTNQTGPLRCIGEVIHAGRRIGTAEARLEDGNGKLYTHATVTCLILPLAQDL